MRQSILLVAGAALAATVPSQNLERYSNAGYGGIKVAFSPTAGNGITLHYGVAWLNGRFYAAHSGAAGIGGSAYEISEFDRSGNFIQTTPQVHTNSGRRGYFDFSTDGTNLIGASDVGLHIFDPTTNALATTVQAANGAIPIPAQPITGNAYTTLGEFRGVAFNPNGNGGNGSFLVGFSDRDLFEIDVAGNVLNTWGAGQGNNGWFVRGIAWDHVTSTYWINAVPHRGYLGQFDPVVGALTGRQINRGMHAFPGGLFAVRDGSFDSELDFVEFSQTGDWAFVQRIHDYAAIAGYDEPPLLVESTSPPNLPGGNLRRGFPAFRAGDLLGFNVDTTNAPSLNGFPGWLAINLGGDALTRATNFAVWRPGNPVLPGLIAPTPVSMPAANPADFIVVPFTLNSPVIISVPATLPIGNDFPVRMQALYLNPASPNVLAATNDQNLTGYSANVIVEAIGENVYWGGNQTGFFKVTHLGGSPIVDVVFDFVASSNPGMTSTEFDTDSSSIGFVFDGGNSTVLECTGTYRNDSATATGLIFDAANTPSTCDSLAFTGFLGTNPGNGADDYRTMQFRFTPGAFDHDRFEFDCDVDQAPNDTGGGMAGMVVTITLQDTTVLTGELQLDPNNPTRSFIMF